MMQPVVTDLSHHNGACDFDKIAGSGIRGVIHKASEGTSFRDKNYSKHRKAAVKAGLLWGAYHFANASDVEKQVAHFLKTAAPDASTLLCLDFEPNGRNTMSLSQAKDFCRLVYERTGQRPVIYSGNLLKEELRGSADDFISLHRLWLAQYGPKAVLPPGFDTYWLWQYTGDGLGPKPHIIPGVSSKVCDLNVFGGYDLTKEWALSTEPKFIVPSKPKPAQPELLPDPKGMGETIAESPTAQLGIGGIVMLVWGYILDGFNLVFNGLLSLLDYAPDSVGAMAPVMMQSEQLAGWLGIPWAKVSLSIVVLMLAGMVLRHVWDRRWLNKNPKPAEPAAAPQPEGGAA